ncbi:hypothetical protein BCV69DRAFT_59296 [Microstroma glucosiphilum]|uniref:Uncharacterized protein n=1 Tax=Pseudomicrostroma glucosiphilum TaxID=1684307 RepID=A0A316U182_9BASI|nr:hypothetical protein BCV69DRAFT_59296 [Pseudomicrostroma glucosiphilum]PWN19057.1 hypothetical protein BCV69DRAFT_59296 [Pseudomicrostroma glucosiphilum]
MIGSTHHTCPCPSTLKFFPRASFGPLKPAAESKQLGGFFVGIPSWAWHLDSRCLCRVSDLVYDSRLKEPRGRAKAFSFLEPSRDLTQTEVRERLTFVRLAPRSRHFAHVAKRGGPFQNAFPIHHPDAIEGGRSLPSSVRNSLSQGIVLYSVYFVLSISFGIAAHRLVSHDAKDEHTTRSIDKDLPRWSRYSVSTLTKVNDKCLTYPTVTLALSLAGASGTTVSSVV